MRFQHQGRSADEPEIPAYPEHNQRCPEMQGGDAGQADGGGNRFQQQSYGHDLWRAETRDQGAGKKAWAIHRNDMPLDAKIGIAEA